MKGKKLALSIVAFILLIFITLYIIFSNYDFYTIYNDMKLVSLSSIMIALLLVLLYFIMQGIYMKYLLKKMDINISIFRGIYYSIVEFFFSAITPGSSGGQPIQLYYMKKDKIPMRKSLIVLILNTIIFKLYLLVGGILILLLKPNYIFDSNILIRIFFFLGFGMDIIAIIGGLLLMYNQKLIKKIIVLIYKLRRLLLKKDYNILEIDELLDNYINEAKFIKKHKKELLVSIIITFIQRTCMFSVLYIIYRSFGFNKISYLELLLLQIFVQISIEGIVLPGGVGANEYVSTNMYEMIFLNLGMPAMILTRTLSFYIPLILIIVIIGIVTKIRYIKD